MNKPMSKEQGAKYQRAFVTMADITRLMQEVILGHQEAELCGEEPPDDRTEELREKMEEFFETLE